MEVGDASPEQSLRFLVKGAVAGACLPSENDPTRTQKRTLEIRRPVEYPGDRAS